MGETQATIAPDKRVEWIDTTRGLAMLFVILGHMDVGKLNHFIFSFHMPVFFLISGYFFRLQDNRELVRKKVKSLLLPYVFTAASVVFTQIVKNVVRIRLHMGSAVPVSESMRNWIIAPFLGSGSRTDYLFFNAKVTIGAIWFLLALFWGLLLVNTLLSYRHGWMGILVVSFIGIFSARYFWLPLSVQSAAAAGIYIGGGYILRNDRLSQLVDSPKILAGCSFVWGLYLIPSFFYNHNISLASARFNWGVVDYLCTIAACIAVLGIVRHGISEYMPHIDRFMRFFGKNSLIVLCFHVFEAQFDGVYERMLGLLGVPDGIAGGCIIYGVKILLMCVAIWAVHRVRILRRVFNVRI